jgi:hypothetical protein
MPKSIIKKIERYGNSNAWPNTLDFANRNGIVFKWNNKVDKYPKGLINVDVVLYPSHPAEILGVVLEQDLPIPMIEDKIEPQGHAEDAAVFCPWK